MVLVEQNDYLVEYELYLINRAYEQDKLNNKVNAILGEAVLDEAAGEAVKGFIDKIIAAITGAWEKFSKTIDDLTTNNNKYLEKHKDIILNKAPKKATLTDIYKYDTDLIQSADIPTFDSNKFMNICGSKEDFINGVSEFKSFMKDPEKSFSDNVKFKFRGGEPVKLDSSQLQLRTMYAYTHDYNTTVKNKIYDSIEKLKAANSKAGIIIGKMSKGSSSTFKAKTNVSTSTTSNNSSEKKETSQNASFTYDETLKYYFNEVDIQDEEPKEDKKEDSNKTTTSTTSTTTDKEEKETNEDAIGEKMVKMYFNVCSEFVSAKMNIANEAYKTYIKIIRWHVKANGGKDEPEAKEDNAENNTEENK